MAASSTIAAAIGTGYLNLVALVSSIIIILGFRFMGSATKLIAWAVLIGWLGMKYTHRRYYRRTVLFCLCRSLCIWILPLAIRPCYRLADIHSRSKDKSRFLNLNRPPTQLA